MSFKCFSDNFCVEINFSFLDSYAVTFHPVRDSYTASFW